ncbi:MAG: V-type ATP synthase subunit E [archaeon]
MGLEKLSRELLVDAKKESDSVIAKAVREAEAIIGAAEERKRKIVEDAKSTGHKMALREKNEKISAANLDAKQLIDEEKNAAIEKALAVVFSQLGELRGNKPYEKLLKSLAVEGIKELGKDSVVIVNSKDHGIAKKLFPNTSKEAENIAGGVIVATKDGLVRVDNSFEALFEQNKDSIKKSLFAELFGQEKTK